jgi:hypothetical protein
MLQKREQAPKCGSNEEEKNYSGSPANVTLWDSIGVSSWHILAVLRYTNRNSCAYEYTEINDESFRHVPTT